MQTDVGTLVRLRLHLGLCMIVRACMLACLRARMRAALTSTCFLPSTVFPAGA